MNNILIFFLFVFRPRSWWKYAIQAVLEPIKETHRRRKKAFIMKHVKLVNGYIPKYTKMLTTEGNVDPAILVLI